MGILTIAQIIIDWCGFKISHIVVLIFVGSLYFFSIIADIYHDRLVLKRQLNGIEQNNSGLQKNIKQLTSDKQLLQSNLNLQKFIISFLINSIPENRMEFVKKQIQLIEEIDKFGKTNQNSKNN